MNENGRETATEALQRVLEQIDAGDIEATDVERAYVAGFVAAGLAGAGSDVAVLPGSGVLR